MTQTWLITGSSRGLGRALAEAVLAAGDRVVATARKPEQLDDLVERYGERRRAVALDVTDARGRGAAVAATVDAFGRLDVSSTTPATPTSTRSRTSTEDDFRAQIETNLCGVVNVTRAALPVLREQGAGHIIQISSLGGRVASPGIGAYQTAKWAVEGFSGVLAKEVEPLGIKVTIIEPGGFRTDWAGSSMTIADDPRRLRADRRRDEPLPPQGDGTPPGDPAKAAQAILEDRRVDKPPLRLLLGNDAFDVAREADEAKIAGDEAWKELTLSTDDDSMIGIHVRAV